MLRLRVREILAIQLDRQRQRHDQTRAGVERDFGDEPVAAFGQRGDDDEREVGIVLAQERERFAHLRAQVRQLRRVEVTMARDADDQFGA